MNIRALLYAGLLTAAVALLLGLDRFGGSGGEHPPADTVATNR
jgi:hypothetical protein